MSRSDQYETFMRDVFEHGVEKSDRTGVGTRSMFGYQMRFNLQEGFRLSRLRNCIFAPSFMSSCGSYTVTPTSNIFTITK